MLVDQALQPVERVELGFVVSVVVDLECHGPAGVPEDDLRTRAGTPRAFSAQLTTAACSEGKWRQ